MINGHGYERKSQPRFSPAGRNKVAGKDFVQPSFWRWGTLLRIERIQRFRVL